MGSHVRRVVVVGCVLALGFAASITVATLVALGTYTKPTPPPPEPRVVLSREAVLAVVEKTADRAEAIAFFASAATFEPLDASVVAVVEAKLGPKTAPAAVVARPGVTAVSVEVAKRIVADAGEDGVRELESVELLFEPDAESIVAIAKAAPPSARPALAEYLLRRAHAPEPKKPLESAEPPSPVVGAGAVEKK